MDDLPRSFVIRESRHRIHNPFTSEKLAALGHALQLSPGTSMLDLACGSGEMLCTWARDHGFTGTGVDVSSMFIGSARGGARELGVEEKESRARRDHADRRALLAEGATGPGNGRRGLWHCPG